MAIAGMIVGICTVPFAFLACSGYGIWFPLLLGIAGIVLSALGMMKDPQRKGMALAGLVCSIVGLVVMIICFACSGCDVCRYGNAVGLLSQYGAP